MSITGNLQKMRTRLEDVTQYELPVGDELLPLNELVGQEIKLTHTGNIYCRNCQRKTKKSFSQGFCFPCMQKLASCDLCIMKPETCHYDAGTCREPEWGEANCMIDHYVYLANTSGLKVGITRHSQIPIRWMDQGATQALPIYKVKTRHISGLVEVELAKYISDKTNWRAILKGNAAPIDLQEQARLLKVQIAPLIQAIKKEHGDDAVEDLSQGVVQIQYPVETFPSKITSFNFDKNAEVSGKLMGIKGQYLLLDTGVINIRKFGSYEVTIER